MKIDFFSWEVSSRFDALAKTHRFLESHVQDAKNIAQSLLPAMPTIPATADEDEVGAAFAVHDEALWWHRRQFEIELPMFIRQSFLSRTYSLFEWAASGIAEQICTRKKLPHNPKLTNPITKSLVSFLEKPDVIANAFAVAQEIEAINDLRAVRHCVVHGEGDPSRLKDKADEQRVEALIASGTGVSCLGKLPSIDPDDSSRIWLEERYCFKAHSEALAFVKKVMVAANCFS